MKKRLEKAVDEYKQELKNKNPEKSSSNLITDSTNLGYESQNATQNYTRSAVSNPIQDSVFQSTNRSNETNLPVNSAEGFRSSDLAKSRINQSVGYDSNPFPDSALSRNISLQSIGAFQNKNLGESKMNQSEAYVSLYPDQGRESKKNATVMSSDGSQAVNLKESKLDQTSYTGEVQAYNLVEGLKTSNQTSNELSKADSIYKYNAPQILDYYSNNRGNLQNPDYLNTSTSNATASNPSQDQDNPDYKSSKFNGSTSTASAYNNTNATPINYHYNETASFISSNSTPEQNYAYINPGYDYRDYSKQNNRNSSGNLGIDYYNGLKKNESSASLTDNAMYRIQNLSSNQYWNRDHNASTAIANPFRGNSSLYDNMKPAWNPEMDSSRSANVINATTSYQLDSNRYWLSGNQRNESVVNLSNQTASGYTAVRSDKNPIYDSSSSFVVNYTSISYGNQRFDPYLNREFSNSSINVNNETSSLTGESRFVNGSSSSTTNEARAQVNGPLDQNPNPDYGSVANLSYPTSTDTVKSGFTWNQANVSYSPSWTNLANKNSTPDSGRLHASINSTQGFSSTDNPRSDLYVNPYQASNATLSLRNDTYAGLSKYQGRESALNTANVSTGSETLGSDFHLNLDSLDGNRSVGLINGSISADNIRSSQYWNPGYDRNNAASKPTNLGSDTSDNIRWDLYWNPGYTRNNLTEGKSNESKEIAVSSYNRDSYWNQENTSKALNGSQNEDAINGAVSAVNISYNASDVLEISLANRTRSVGQQISSFKNSDYDLTSNGSSLAESAGNASSHVIDSAVDYSKMENVTNAYDYAKLQNETNTESYIADTSKKIDANAEALLTFNSTSAKNDSISYYNNNVAYTNGDVGSYVTTPDKIGKGNATIEDGGYQYGNASQEAGNQFTSQDTDSQKSLSSVDGGNVSTVVGGTYKSGQSPTVRNEISNQRKSGMLDQQGDQKQGRVRMVMKNWRKITSNIEKSRKDLSENKSTRTVKKLEINNILKGKIGAVTDSNSNKVLEREGLFVKPGLNRGNNIIVYFTLLYFTLLYFTLLYFTLLYFTLLYFTLLYFTLLYFTLLYFTSLYFTLLFRGDRDNKRY